MYIDGSRSIAYFFGVSVYIFLYTICVEFVDLEPTLKFLYQS